MKRIIGMMLLAALVTGCTTIKPKTTPTPPLPPKPTASWENREETLSRIQSWQVKGKIAVQTAKNSGSATVTWIKHPGHYTITLLGPLGSNGMQLSGRPGNVTLIMADGKHFTATNPETLLAERWGFHVPVSNLAYWIRGLAVTGIPSTIHYDTEHRISELTQQGWHIAYLSYLKKDGLDLPSKMALTSSSLKVKIIIYAWEVGNS